MAKHRANRGALPAHLLRIEITLEPEVTACPCCRAAMAVIGEDKSERLDVIPAQFPVLVTKRPKLARLIQRVDTVLGRLSVGRDFSVRLFHRLSEHTWQALEVGGIG